MYLKQNLTLDSISGRSTTTFGRNIDRTEWNTEPTEPIFGRTDLRKGVSEAKFDVEADFDVKKSLAPPKSAENHEKPKQILKIFQFFFRFSSFSVDFRGARVFLTSESSSSRFFALDGQIFRSVRRLGLIFRFCTVRTSTCGEIYVACAGR